MKLQSLSIPLSDCRHVVYSESFAFSENVFVTDERKDCPSCVTKSNPLVVSVIMYVMMSGCEGCAVAVISEYVKHCSLLFIELQHVSYLYEYNISNLYFNLI